MSKLTVIIDEFATSKEEDILFLKNYDDFLNHWEVVLEALWETEGKIIISHPIIKDYFVSLREAVRDRIEILESNPRMQLAKALGVKQDDLNYLSYQEILKHKLLEKINRSPLEVGEDPFLWILKNLSQRPFLVSNRINCHWSFKIPQVMDTRIPHPQGYLICVLESIAMGASPHGATAYLFGH